MLGTYLKLACRVLWRHRIVTFVNLVGLAAALAVCLLVYFYVDHEWSYDRFNARGDRVFVVWQRVMGSGMAMEFGTTMVAPPVNDALVSGMPGITRMAVVQDLGASVVLGDERLRVTPSAVDPALFHLLTLPLALGDSARALADPRSLILGHEAAIRYFGTGNPVGRTLTLEFHGLPPGFGPPQPTIQEAFTVTGVLAPLAGRSSFAFDLLIPRRGNERLPAHRPWRLFVELDSPDQAPAIEAQLTRLAGAAPQGNMPLPTIHLLPLTEVHWSAAMGLRSGGDRNRGYALLGVGVLILVVACLNFVTLALARASSRVAEIGIRQAVGAARHHLRTQFLLESLVLSGLAAALGLALSEALLPSFGTLMQVDLSASPLTARAGAFAAGLAVLVGLAAGAYPALVASRLEPVGALAHRHGPGLGGRRWLGRIALVLQFAISAFLLVIALVIGRQVTYASTKDLGFDAEGVLILSGGMLTPDQVALAEARLVRSPAILAVAGVSPAPGQGEIPGQWNRQGQLLPITQFQGSPGIVATLGLRILQGRDFRPEGTGSDAEAVLVNQTMARLLGSEPVGVEVQGLSGEEHPLRVIGVVQDFHQGDMRRPILPAFIRLVAPGAGRTAPPFFHVLVRLDPGRIAEGTDQVQRAWAELFPDHRLSYAFLTDSFASMYGAEERWGRAAKLATAFALAITCAGLFALTALAVQRRTKEIGIRKIIGAGVPGLLLLLSGESAWLVVAGNALAWPAAYWVASRWLERFAYRSELSFGLFLLCGLLVLAVALLTVAGHTLRAALANPVDALRYE